MINYDLKLIRIVAGGYGLLISAVVVSASCGWFPSAFNWVRSLVSDKVLHFLLVGLMALLLNLAIGRKPVYRSIKWLLWGTAIMLVVATVEEFSQILFSRRTFDWLDLGCNYLGIILIGSLVWFFQPKFSRLE